MKFRVEAITPLKINQDYQMTSLQFYPIGNADCCQISTRDNKRILFDFAHIKEAENEDDKRCDLSSLLGADLKKSQKDYFDIVAFTHLDRDHCCGAGEFFYFEHAGKYQGPGRIKIRTLWVPAAAILEDNDPCEDARIIRQEARHRLKKGQGIRIFSRPEILKEWLESEGLSLHERQHLITDAGNVIPGLSLIEDGVEFFLHSPFAKHLDDGSLEERNVHSIVVQAVFQENNQETKLILGSDATAEVWQDIVNISKYHDNQKRLEWDIFELPHHCSYKSLAEDKGKTRTDPVAELKWLFEQQGQRGGIMISTSNQIPSGDTTQPPHFQAANYYKDVANKIGGQFIVTMEHPTSANPEPTVIEIDESKARVKKQVKSAAFAITSQMSPRAG